MNSPNVSAVKSADRALAVIEYLASAGPVGFSVLMEALALPRSSAHGLLQTLVHSGWVIHDPRSREYSLGLRAWQIGQAYRGHTTLVDVSRSVMRELRLSLNETVQLAQLDGTDCVYLAIEESDRPMRLASSVGARLSSHVTGLGKVLLAQLEDEELVRRAGMIDYSPPTERSIRSEAELLAAVRGAREAGFATDDEEYVSGCRCVAVPLAQGSSGQLYAISITMPTSRTTGGWPHDIVTPLREAAERISAQVVHI